MSCRIFSFSIHNICVAQSKYSRRLIGNTCHAPPPVGILWLSGASRQCLNTRRQLRDVPNCRGIHQPHRRGQFPSFLSSHHFSVRSIGAAPRGLASLPLGKRHIPRLSSCSRLDPGISYHASLIRCDTRSLCWPACAPCVTHHLQHFRCPSASTHRFCGDLQVLTYCGVDYAARAPEALMPIEQS